MDEYFCPNCDATLNDQYGFDPDKGVWTCTECGQRLMDEDIFDGDMFEGVEWRCDNCNALLNRQYGFSDSCGTWTCTECGHCNPICENEIIDDGEIIRCPNCDGVLNKQFCYCDFYTDWECTFCGTKLHRDCTFDDYSIVDDCDSVGSYEDEDDYDYYDCEDEDNDCEEDDDEYNDNSSKSQRHSTETRKKQTRHQQPIYIRPDNELRKIRVKAFIFNHKKIQIGFDYTDLLRKNISEVKAKLYNQAFKNIKVIPIYDIYVDSKHKEGEVEQIIIGGSSFFEASNFIPYDTEIIITYHLKKRILIPFTRNSLLKKDYIYVGDKFQELGFTKIYERPIKDLITGWITKDGSVEKVYIANSDSFKKNSSYDYDVEIVIEYHTFKKKKT